MAEVQSARHPGLEPTHPGQPLREEVLPALQSAAAQAARRPGVTRRSLHRILAEEAALPPGLPLGIGESCGNGPGLRLRMRHAHHLWHARRMVGVAAIPTFEAARIHRSR